MDHMRLEKAIRKVYGLKSEELAPLRSVKSGPRVTKVIFGTNLHPRDRLTFTLPTSEVPTIIEEARQNRHQRSR